MPYIKNIQHIKLLSNLLNVILHFGFTILLNKWAKEKKKMIPFCEEKKKKKIEEKQNSTAIMISVDGKRTIFPVKLKWEQFE